MSLDRSTFPYTTYSTSPLLYAMRAENRELIAEAVAVLCRTLREPPRFLMKKSAKWKKERWERLVYPVVDELKRTFGINEGEEGAGKQPRRLTDLYRAAQGLPSSGMERKELETFADVLGDGYILCQYINKLASRPITTPIEPLGDAISEDDAIDNVEEFLWACRWYGVCDDDLFIADDFAEADNENLARVASTILAASRHKKASSNTFTYGDQQANDSIIIFRGDLQEHTKARRATLSTYTTPPESVKPMSRSADASPLSLPNVKNPAHMRTLVTLFSTIFRERHLYREFLSLRERPAQMCLDTLQQIIDNRLVGQELQNMFAIALLRLSVKSSLYPSCLVLDGVERETFPVASGHFGDVYKGSYCGKAACIKVVRLYKGSNIDHALKTFTKEAILWSQTIHPNVLPFYGVYQLYEGQRRICLVSPWMDNGNIHDYLASHSYVARLPLARDVARGLKYLHREKNIVHGDLKGPNILVTPLGRACLADFGLSSMLADFEVLGWSSIEGSGYKGGTVRWRAPELIDPDRDPNASKASDVYAFACVCYEIFTGRIPFFEVARDYTVMLLVMNGKRPTRPSNTSEVFTKYGLTEEIWSLMEDCWQTTPTDRPKINDMYERLSRSTIDSKTTECAIDECDVMSPTDFRSALVASEVLAGLIDVLSKIVTNFPDLGCSTDLL